MSRQILYNGKWVTVASPKVRKGPLDATREKAERVHALRAQGLTFKAIGERMGFSTEYAHILSKQFPQHIPKPKL